MSEPRRRDAGPRPPRRAGPGPYPAARSREPGARRGARGRQAPSGRRPRRWGALPPRTGVCIVIAAAAGMVVTVASGSEPGLALGLFLVAGTVAGALAVRPRAVYRIIPVPALAYVAAAAVCGMIRDRATDASLTGLAISATQWIASGFLAMTIATAVAIVITATRWRSSRRGRRGPGSPRSAAVRQPPPRDSTARPPADRSHWPTARGSSAAGPAPGGIPRRDR